MTLAKLNFEDAFEFKIKQDKDKFFIYDPTRKIWLLITPEEWVRQHWIQYFRRKKGIHFSALITEQKILINGTTKRIDLMVTEKTMPKTLVECKAPDIKLTERSFEQIARYNSVLGAEEIILSNGLHHITAKRTAAGYEFFNFKY